MTAAVELGHLGGLKGGGARAKVLSSKRKSEIAAMGARAKNKGE
jgi:stage V sporulation protein SpoVS